MFTHIDDDTALDMLIERVKFWDDDETTVDLFTQYYREKIQQGSYSNFDVGMIVDNDYINWFTIGTREDIEDSYGEVDENRVLAESGKYILYAKGGNLICH